MANISTQPNTTDPTPPAQLTAFQQANGGSGAEQFMDGSGFNASGKTVAAPSNVSSIPITPNATPTIPPVIPTPTIPASSSSTPASLGLSYTADPNQSAEDAASTASGKASGYLDANGNPTTAPDQNTVYNNTVSQFQSEIDSLNQAAAAARSQINAKYIPIEANRVGESTAIQSRRGLLGSDFGAAQTDTVNAANADELNGALASSDASYNDKINALYTQARTISDSDYQNKLNAYTQGADATVKYLQGKTATAQANASQLAQQAVIQGIDLSDPKNGSQLTQLAQQLGIQPAVLVDAYKAAASAAVTAKAAQDKADADLALTKAQTAKAGQTTVAQGSEVIGPDGNVIASGQPKTINAGKYGTLAYDPVTDTYKPIAAPALPTGSGSGGKPATISNYEVDPTSGKTYKVTTKNGVITSKVEQKTSSTVPQNVIDAAGANLQKVKGADGAVSPDVYNQGLQQWLAAGYPAATYQKNFGSFAKSDTNSPYGSPSSSYNLY